MDLAEFSIIEQVQGLIQVAYARSSGIMIGLETWFLKSREVMPWV
jgi:hypothetical protein